MTHKDLGTLILVCAIGMLLIAIARAVVWHADIGSEVALGCVFVGLGIAVRQGKLGDRGAGDGK